MSKNQQYYKERELEYRAILPQWFEERHKVAQGFKRAHVHYIYEIIRCIRAYSNCGDFKKYQNKCPFKA